METIGVAPMEALVLPRVLATVSMMPLLAFYAAIIATVGGGIFCWISLGIPPITFIQRTREVVPRSDLWELLIKAPVFGLIISMAGCFQGMQVESNAEEVGLRTTTAVVQAIFLVIVLDAFFGRRPRQKQPRFDLGQNRGHHEVFGGQFQFHVAHQVDVVDVLARDFRDRNIEDVEVLAADQVKQKIERTLERFEDDFQRVRRNVQILRHLQHGLAAHQRQRHFLLLRDGREDGGVGAVG